MAGIKISALPAEPGAVLTDVYATVQGGVTYKGTLSQLATLFNANLTFLPLAGGTLTGPLILNSSTPTTALEAASKGYVDTIAQGITVQGACRLGTTAALTVTYSNGVAGVGATLTNAGAQVALTLDGVAAAVNDRILVKNQASTLQNGIYTVTNIGSGATNWVLTRALDYDQPAEVNPGDLIVITAGTTLTSSSWLETATVTTIGTDPITFSQFTASLPVSVPNGGTGLTSVASGTTLYATSSNVLVALPSKPMIQQVRNLSGTVQTGTTTMGSSNAIRQNTEGDQYYSVAITPTNVANLLEIDIQVDISNSNASAKNLSVALFQDAIANALVARAVTQIAATTSFNDSIVIKFYMVAGTTSATTFKVRAGCDGAGTTAINGVPGGTTQGEGGVGVSGITIKEWVV
jgi:hypothetical protein